MIQEAARQTVLPWPAALLGAVLILGGLSIATPMAWAGTAPPATGVNAKAADRSAPTFRGSRAPARPAAMGDGSAARTAGPKPPLRNRFVPAAPAFKPSAAQISARPRSTGMAGVIGGPGHDPKKAAMLGGSVKRRTPN